MESRFLEVRADGRVITGAALNYGDVARLRAGREVFDPRPFGDVSALDVIANIQHNRERPLARTGGGGLTLNDSAERLAVRADLPNTRDADDALELVRTGVLRGWSIEFDPHRESQDGDLRRIHRALLGGLGLVDRPAYRQSLAEVRQEGEGLACSFFYDRDQVIVDSGRRRKQRVKSGAFDFALGQPDREITIVLGGPDKPLASKMGQTVQFQDTPQSLNFRIPRLPQTSYALDFLELLRTGAVVAGIIPFFLIPPNIDGAESEEEEEGNPGVFRHIIGAALLTSLTVMFRAPRGNPGSVQAREEDTPALVIPKRRKRLWL